MSEQQPQQSQPAPRCFVDAQLSLRVNTPGRVALSVAVAESAGTESEELIVTGPTVTPKPVSFPHGTRIHLLDLPEGEVTLHYRAARECPIAQAPEVTDADGVLYTRPSRYCPSDRLGATAWGEFGSLDGVQAKVEAIVAYVARRTFYLSGSSRHTDDAVNTLLAGEGVCRDFAHLGVGLCRAMDIPARFVSAYAPGLSPMDFHAVFEAAIDGRWQVFDATGLAPRQSMTRIATGRDAADTAFLTTLAGEIDFLGSTVLATIDPALPEDDGSGLVALA